MGIGSGLLSAAGSAVGIMQTNKTAEAAAQNAVRAANYDYQLLNLRQQQVNEKAAQQAFERQRQGLRERSKVLVATGEAGVLGNTPLREMYNTMFQTGYDTGIIEQNRVNQSLQVQAYKEGVKAQAESRINQAESMVTNPWMAILKIGMSGLGAGLSGWATGNQLFPEGD
jgi:hypothetical protein